LQEDTTAAPEERMMFLSKNYSRFCARLPEIQEGIPVVYEKSEKEFAHEEHDEEHDDEPGCSALYMHSSYHGLPYYASPRDELVMKVSKLRRSQGKSASRSSNWHGSFPVGAGWYPREYFWKSHRKEGGMSAERSLDISLGDVAPGPGFTRMPQSPLEGRHTGGPFFCPSGREVWKPLDCLPYPNAEYRLPTREAEVLELMAGKPGFPRNWRVEVANGRRFLVRKLACVIGETFETTSVTRAHVSLIEQAIRALNSRYWEVGEVVGKVLKGAIDPDTDEPFILDLSNASVRKHAPEKLYADDQFLFEQWAWQFDAGRPLVSLRRSARRV
jgi:hypothetical protein